MVRALGMCSGAGAAPKRSRLEAVTGAIESADVNSATNLSNEHFFEPIGQVFGQYEKQNIIHSPILKYVPKWSVTTA